jgi:predicted  nucleic acid-binding Zn-ribbon protein
MIYFHEKRRRYHHRLTQVVFFLFICIVFNYNAQRLDPAHPCDTALARLLAARLPAAGKTRTIECQTPTVFDSDVLAMPFEEALRARALRRAELRGPQDEQNRRLEIARREADGVVPAFSRADFGDDALALETLECAAQDAGSEWTSSAAFRRHAHASALREARAAFGEWKATELAAVKTADAATLESRVETEIARIRSNTTAEIDAARSTADATRQRYDALTAQLQASVAAQRNDLERQALALSSTEHDLRASIELERSKCDHREAVAEARIAAISQEMARAKAERESALSAMENCTSRARAEATRELTTQRDDVARREAAAECVLRESVRFQAELTELRKQLATTERKLADTETAHKEALQQVDDVIRENRQLAAGLEEYVCGVGPVGAFFVICALSFNFKHIIVIIVIVIIIIILTAPRPLRRRSRRCSLSWPRRGRCWPRRALRTHRRLRQRSPGPPRPRPARRGPSRLSRTRPPSSVCFASGPSRPWRSSNGPTRSTRRSAQSSLRPSRRPRIARGPRPAAALRRTARRRGSQMCLERLARHSAAYVDGR